MKKSVLSALMLAAFGMSGSIAVAGIIALPDGSYMVSESTAKPNRGIRQGDVLRQFGEPVLRHAPVGQPAISSWEYETFAVYFENGVVIHAVDR
jgi:hypothetical protein